MSQAKIYLENFNSKIVINDFWPVFCETFNQNKIIDMRDAFTQTEFDYFDELVLYFDDLNEDEKFMDIFENSSDKLIDITFLSDNFFDKKFQYVKINFNRSDFRYIIESLIFVEDFKRAIIAGGSFFSITNNYFTKLYPTISKSFDEIIDIFIFTTRIHAYLDFYSLRSDIRITYFETERNYNCFYIIWRENCFRVIFPCRKQNTNFWSFVKEYENGFDRLFFSMNTNRIFASVELFEKFPRKNNSIRKYIDSIYDLIEINHELYQLNEFLFNNFLKLIFKGFYCDDDKEKITKILKHYFY
jgi:hypothetical protein